MFLIFIVLALLLLFVLFAKRPVNMSGLRGHGAPIDPPAKPAPTPAENASQGNAPVAAVAPATPDTMNFNDIFAAKPSTKTDHTNP